MNNMEKEDKMIVEINGEEIPIYPLMQLTENEVEYVVYTTTNNLEEVESNIYIGVLEGENILPVADDLLSYFDGVVQDIIKKINS